MKLQQTFSSAVDRKGRDACGVSACVWYTNYFLYPFLAKLVFKLDLSKYVYCTLEVYTGADIQPKSLYRFSSDIFTDVFFKKKKKSRIILSW